MGNLKYVSQFFGTNKIVYGIRIDRLGKFPFTLLLVVVLEVSWGLTSLFVIGIHNLSESGQLVGNVPFCLSVCLWVLQHLNHRNDEC